MILQEIVFILVWNGDVVIFIVIQGGDFYLVTQEEKKQKNWSIRQGLVTQCFFQGLWYLDGENN